RESADCVRNNSSAARVNESWRAAASKPLSRSSEGRRGPARGFASAVFSIPRPHAAYGLPAPARGTRRSPPIPLSGRPPAGAPVPRMHAHYASGAAWRRGPAPCVGGACSAKDECAVSIPFSHASHAANSLVKLPPGADTSVAKTDNTAHAAIGRCMNPTHEPGDCNAIRSVRPATRPPRVPAATRIADTGQCRRNDDCRRRRMPVGNDAERSARHRPLARHELRDRPHRPHGDRRRRGLALPPAVGGHAHEPRRRLARAAGGALDAPPGTARRAVLLTIRGCTGAAAASGQRLTKLSLPALAATCTVSPGPKSPLRISVASGFSICCWIARLSGRAP